MKNFSCTVCGAKFRRKAHLENHRRKIHKDTSDVSGKLELQLDRLSVYEYITLCPLVFSYLVLMVLIVQELVDN